MLCFMMLAIGEWGSHWFGPVLAFKGMEAHR